MKENQLIKKTKLSKSRFTVCAGAALDRFVLEPFWYEIDGHDLTAFSEETLTVPFILNIAPVVWLSGRRLHITSMDETLSQALVRLRNWFRNHFPEMQWEGEIVPDNIVSSHPMAPVPTIRPALLFSGGLDSVTSLYRHISETPLLISVHGADIQLRDYLSWKVLSDLACRYGEENGLQNVFVRSNILDFLNQHLLGKIAKTEISWWGNIQHGMGLAGLAFPVCDFHRCPTLLIASSLWKETQDESPVRWGTAPEAIDLIRYRSMKVQDDYQVSRQEKMEYLKRLGQEMSIYPKLRVCFRSKAGINCGHCEKCLRTVAGILVTGVENLPIYGFPEPIAVYVERLKAMFESRKVRMGRYHVMAWNDMKAHLPDSPGDHSSSPIVAELREWVRSFNFMECHSRQRPSRNRRAEFSRFMALRLPWVYSCLRRLWCQIHLYRYSLLRSQKT